MWVAERDVGSKATTNAGKSQIMANHSGFTQYQKLTHLTV